MPRRVLILLISLILVSSAYADELPPLAPPPLNKISYQLTVEKWATTDTAKITIHINAALDKVGLSSINTHILDNLRKLAANADWHITQFNRSQDKSELEMLHAEAEARLSQNALASVREKTKAISKTGETYTLGDIDFTPTLSEMEKTHADARAAAYHQVKLEIATLNQLYPEQHYFLNELTFTPAPIIPAPVMFKSMRAMSAETATDPVPTIPVNAKVTESAQVVIASQLAANKP